jgi:hypothetical protein
MIPARDAVARDQWLAERGEGIGIIEVDNRAAIPEAAIEIDAELLDHVTLHFSDGDLEHHLVAAANVEIVDDLLGAADQLGGDIGSLGGLGSVRDRARQHHALADAVDAHVRVRQELLQHRARSVEIARHRDVEAGDLPALGVEEIDVGLPDRDADQISTARRAHDRVGEFRFRNQHVLDVARQVDHDRLSDAELNETRRGIRADHLDRSGRRGHEAVGLRGARVERCAEECRREHRGERGPCQCTRRHFTRPLQSSFRHGHGADAEAHRVDSRTPSRGALIAWQRRFAGVGETPQRERECAELTRQCERLGLTR